MKAVLVKGLALSTLMVTSLVALSAPAFAADAVPTKTYQANLSALNNSKTSGTATVEVKGNQVTVKINTTGASANLAHAQQIFIGGNKTCSTMADDANKDGVLDVKEGMKQYGDIKVALTTTGDTSNKSALATDRFPTANKDGVVTYSRTFTLPSGVAGADIANGVIVQHGVASLTGDKAKYDGSAKSELDNKLSREVTAPAACGKLTAMPMGGANTGGGAISGVEYAGLMGVGAAAVIAGGVMLAMHKRSVRE